jgi:hypothetical protein
MLKWEKTEDLETEDARKEVGQGSVVSFECGEEPTSFKLAYASMASSRQAGDERGASGADRLPRDAEPEAPWMDCSRMRQLRIGVG